MQAVFFLFLLWVGPASGQSASIPLESVTIEGSGVPQATVLEIAGLRVGTPIDKAGIEEACRKLQESGVFGSINYRYGPGPKNGYAVTLSLTDQAPLAAAVIDVPGVDEKAAWRWLVARYGRFDREAPQAEAAQKHLAIELERHLGGKLRGQHLTVRMETDLTKQNLTLSFQPEVLPRVQSVVFEGNQAVSAGELAAALDKILAGVGYTDRGFARAVELNVRPVYEEHGYYRVQFAPSAPEWKEGGVAVKVGVKEGALFQLGTVEFVGAELPVEKMMAAGKFPLGKTANGKQIQQGIWEAERVLKTGGYFDAAGKTERTFDDGAHVLNLRVRIEKGPLYRFGALRIRGLSADQEGKARKLWKLKAGDPYDLTYVSTFFQSFGQAVDMRSFRKTEVQSKKGAGEHVQDVELVFEAR